MWSVKSAKICASVKLNFFPLSTESERYNINFRILMKLFSLIFFICLNSILDCIFDVYG